jgi:hypothetical protein
MNERQKTLANLVILLVILFLTQTHVNNTKVIANGLPILQIAPSYYLVDNPNEPFSLNLTIANVTDLYGWEVKIYYPRTIIEYNDAIEDGFLRSAGDTFWVSPVADNNYNTTHGRVLLACSLMGMVAGTSGFGVLSTVSFRAVGGGLATLHLADTKLADSHVPVHNPIVHTAADGAVDVATFHNIVITQVQSMKTATGSGYSMNVSVTLANWGTSTETFNVTIYANGTFATRKQFTLEQASEITSAIVWNTNGWGFGNRTILAAADIVPGETITSDNTLADGWVVVTIPGDIDGNFKVNLSDLVLLAQAYGSRLSEPRYRINADIDNNAVVGLSDLVALAQHYGQQYP